MTWPVETARQEDWAAALPLACDYLPPDEKGLTLQDLETQLRNGDLSAEAIRIIRGPRGVMAAMLHVPLPGRLGFVWPPGTLPGPLHATLEDLLVQDALACLAASGVRLCGCELSPDAFPARSPALLRNGFRHVTTLRQLVLDLRFGSPSSRCECHFPNVQFVHFPEVDRTEFLQTLARTYEKSLDCPEANDVRTPEDALDSYLDRGKADVRRWWLVREADRPAGVLMLGSVNEPITKLLYLGLVPEARGRGLGKALLSYAVQQVMPCHVQALTLTVDSRNLPALRLYRGAGFSEAEQIELLMAVLEPGGSKRGACPLEVA